MHWIIVVVLAVAYAKTQNICGNGVVGFSGFKVVRQYKLSLGGFKPLSQQFISLVHCSRGREDYQTTIKVDSITLIPWDRPFCLYKPRLGSYLPALPEDTVQNLVFNSTRNSTVVKNSQHPTTLLSKVKLYLGTKIDNLLEALAGHNKLVHYKGKATEEHIKDIESATMEASMQWESRNLVCYKLARRKKYAKRDISFYIPLTFVGGLYECYIPPEKKKEIFKRISKTPIAMQFEFECDPYLSQPIMPLIADVSSNQWWTFKKDPFSPSAMQYIPFLTTSPPFHMRFLPVETSDMHHDTWASKLKVNEDYDYSDLDLHLISEAVASTSDFIYKLLKPLSFGHMIKEQEELKNIKFMGKPVAETDLVINFVKQLADEQKISVLLSLKPSTYAKKVEQLQNIWETIQKTTD